jgi:hypothetical protein
MTPALVFQQLFRGILARQVEYSYTEEQDRVTTMIPLNHGLLPRVIELANMIPFAGEWGWAVDRFAGAIRPDAFLFRLDWRQNEPTAVTLYCRFPSEPDTAEFQKAIGYARPFRWQGPDTASIAASLDVKGPRGIAFRAAASGSLHSAAYFRSEQHAGASWSGRLSGLLAACRLPGELATTIEEHLKQLYGPGPTGVIGVDDGEDGAARALKFDPSNVSLRVLLSFLTGVGVSEARIAELKAVAVGLRAESVSYAGVQYGKDGLSGWRVYFSCEPTQARIPGHTALSSRQTLRSVRRLPHY